MAELPENVEWVADLIPGLAGRGGQFSLDADEVDDELAQVFVEELRRLTGELQDGLSQKNTEMIRVAAHSIKGMGGTLGFPEISVVGQEIEIKAMAGFPDEVQSLVEALSRWLTTLE